uniref:Uncharacterized protein n=1 Tax=Panagrolaimus sp. ES5 TaxID=591445 RepID=A0AC34G558_9BILA
MMKIIPFSPPPSNFPPDVLKWIKENANPKTAPKTMQICKYFQYPDFFAVKTMEGNDQGWRYRSRLDINNRNMDLQALTSKIWITEELVICSEMALIFLLPKIRIYSLELTNFDIPFDEFKILTAAGKIRTLKLKGIFVIDENGDDVPMEDILKEVPKIEDLILERDVNSFISPKNVPSSLKKIMVWDVKEGFDFETCFKLIKNNPQIFFIFYCSLPAGVQEKLRILTDSLEESWPAEYPSPQITFKPKYPSPQNNFAKQTMRELDMVEGLSNHSDKMNPSNSNDSYSKANQGNPKYQNNPNAPSSLPKNTFNSYIS